MSDELTKACAPWENGSIEIPDGDSPLHIVFQAGISYALQQVGAAVGAVSWEGGDGTETIEGDVHVEICNILKAADIFEDEYATLARHAELRTARARIAALESFKSYVHERLDGMGIPVDPPGEHSDAGCRVGQRLDVVEDRIAALEAALENTNA